MQNKSLRFKMIVGGVIGVLLPLFAVGGLSIYKSMNALEDVSRSQSTEVAKGLAHMANLAVQEELKTINQLAVRDVVISAAEKRDEPASDKATAELTKFV